MEQDKNLLVIERESNGNRQEFEIIENERTPTASVKIERIEQLSKNRTKCEVWSRVVGYLRPVKNWNDGKQEEWKDRKFFEMGQILLSPARIKS